MIVKLVNPGSHHRYVEAVDVLQQFTEGGNVDLEIVNAGGAKFRFLIGELKNACSGDLWARAYIMENGKTVDKIRPVSD